MSLKKLANAAAVLGVAAMSFATPVAAADRPDNNTNGNCGGACNGNPPTNNHGGGDGGPVTNNGCTIEMNGTTGKYYYNGSHLRDVIVTRGGGVSTTKSFKKASCGPCAQAFKESTGIKLQCVPKGNNQPRITNQEYVPTPGLRYNK